MAKSPLSVTKSPLAGTNTSVFLYRTTLALSVSLPFLVPFDAFRNTELQGSILIVAGLLAMITLFKQHARNHIAGLGRYVKLALLIIATCTVVSIYSGTSLVQGLYGAPHVRIGALGLLSFLSLGFLSLRVPAQQLLLGLYLWIAFIALSSIPYSYFVFHSFMRMGGVFAQADIFACVLGCGVILGKYTLQEYPVWRWKIIVLQTILGVLIIASGTRSIILLLILFAVFSYLPRLMSTSTKYKVILLVTVLAFASIYSQVDAQRFSSIANLKQSISYRLNLQKSALVSSSKRPLFGYGVGTISEGLKCETLYDAALQTTCKRGYYFDSSHNIFLDKILAVGWVGGLAFLFLTVYAIKSGFKQDTYSKTFAVALLFISLYYLTNVTNITLELLFWLLLIRCLSVSRA